MGLPLPYRVGETWVQPQSAVDVAQARRDIMLRDKVFLMSRAIQRLAALTGGPVLGGTIGLICSYGQLGYAKHLQGVRSCVVPLGGARTLEALRLIFRSWAPVLMPDPLLMKAPYLSLIHISEPTRPY